MRWTGGREKESEREREKEWEIEMEKGREREIEKQRMRERKREGEREREKERGREKKWEREKKKEREREKEIDEERGRTSEERKVLRRKEILQVYRCMYQRANCTLTWRQVWSNCTCSVFTAKVTKKKRFCKMVGLRFCSRRIRTAVDLFELYFDSTRSFSRPEAVPQNVQFINLLQAMNPYGFMSTSFVRSNDCRMLTSKHWSNHNANSDNFQET